MFALSSNNRRKVNGPDYKLTKSDVALYKMVGVFAIASIFVLLVMKMADTVIERQITGRNLTYNFYEFFHTPIFAVLAAVLLIGSAAWFIYSKIKKIDESTRIFSSANCLVLVLYLAFFSLCFGLRPLSMLHGFFVAVTIALAAVYYISKFYNADFTFYSLVTAFMSVAMYLWAQNFGTLEVVIKVLCVFVAAAACIVFRKKIAELRVSRKKKTSFLVFPSYISAAIGCVFLFWRYFTLNGPLFITLGGMLTVMFVQYIVFAIVYTIRLIRD